MFLLPDGLRADGGQTSGGLRATGYYDRVPVDGWQVTPGGLPG